MFLVCGEALFDFFLEAEEGPGAARFGARAGGSPFNVAVGLARLGQRAALLTGLSDDLLGQRLRLILEAERVSTALAIPTGRPTTISMVGLDAEGVPTYQFYGHGSADSGITAAEMPALGPEVSGLHFGSFSIVAHPVADAFAALAAREGGRFIALDPNVRPSIEPDMAVWRARIDALLPHVDVLKISSEDAALLAPGLALESLVADLIARGVGLVVMTDGSASARGWTAAGITAAAVPPTVTIADTVGAGDTFQAALIHQLLAVPGGPQSGIAALDAGGLSDMLAFAARAAAITCSRRGADLPHHTDIFG